MRLTFREFYVCSELARRDALGKSHRYGRQIWYGLNEERKIRISTAAVYKAIKKLKDMGWVEVNPGDATKNYTEGSRNYCRLTDLGRNGFVQEAAEVEANLDQLRSAAEEGRRGLERAETDEAVRKSKGAEDDDARRAKDTGNVG